MQPDSPAATGYDRWTRAIFDWSTSNYSEGDAVFLSVDERTLHLVRRQYLGVTTGTVADAVSEFQAAVREQVIDGSTDRIDLCRVEGECPGGAPKCVGFLSALVFAAHQMAEDAKAEDETYFIRLCEVLGLNPRKGYRPPGMEIRPNHPAPEEPLWQRWNHWLVRQGFQATATRGQGTKDKYSYYAISQALLRKGEKVRLAKWFRECERDRSLTRHCDRDLLASQLPEVVTSLDAARVKRLLLDTSDARHFDAIVDAVCEVYDAIDWDDPLADLELMGPRRLRAGLYRTEDFITGAVRYFLYPRVPRRWNGGALTVTAPGGARQALRVQRPGWFFPLWPIELGEERSYELIGDEELTRVVLPHRDFWILVHDPDDEASSVLASWAAPANGQTFFVVCRAVHARQLEALKDEKLLNWDEMVEVRQGDEVWFEFRECQVESSRWSRVLAQAGCEELIHALRPVQRVNIALEGGLRVPGLPVWLEGHQPELKLYQFGGTVELRVLEAANLENVVYQATSTVNEKVPLDPLPAGEYVIEAKSGTACATRRMRLASWATLGARLADSSFPLRVNGYLLRGASLKQAGA